MTSRDRKGKQEDSQNLIERKIIGLIVSGCLALGTGIGGAIAANRENVKVCPLSDQVAQVVTMTQYQSIKIGDTLTDVRAILGNGIEVSSSKEDSSFEWRNCHDSYIALDFREGKLIRKSQYGLLVGPKVLARRVTLRCAK